MARVELRIIADTGEELTTKTYDLGQDQVLNKLSKIEYSVEKLRPQILTDISRELLEAEQRRYEKKVV